MWKYLIPVAAMAIPLAVWNYRRFVPKPIAVGEHAYPVQKKQLCITANGRRIYGELLTPVGKTGKLPVVICSHGLGSSYMLVENLIGKTLAMSGFAAYCFDFCGGSKKSKSDLSMMDMSVITEKEDLLGVIDFIKSQPEVDSDALFLFGESQGGMVSALAAAECPDDIRAMVLYYPAFCIPHDARVRRQADEGKKTGERVIRPNVGDRYNRDVIDMDVYQEIEPFKKPVFIIHGDGDKVVNVSYGKEAARRYHDAKFEVLPGEPHGFTGKGRMKAAEMTVHFLNEQLSEHCT